MAITKWDLAGEIDKRLQIKDRQLVDEILSEFQEVLFEKMYDNNVIQLNGLGRFQLKYKENMINPKTKEKLGPMFIPKFTFTNTFRTKIKAKKADYFINESKKDGKESS